MGQQFELPGTRNAAADFWDDEDAPVHPADVEYERLALAREAAVHAARVAPKPKGRK